MSCEKSKQKNQNKNWRAINEKSQAVNNHNARKNSVIVIFVESIKKWLKNISSEENFHRLQKINSQIF